LHETAYGLRLYGRKAVQRTIGGDHETSVSRDGSQRIEGIQRAPDPKGAWGSREIQGGGRFYKRLGFLLLDRNSVLSSI